MTTFFGLKTCVFRCVFNFLLLCAALLLPLPGVGSNLAVAAQGQSIAFYYQQVDSVRELLSYDRVVVSPAGITPRQLSQLQTAGVQVFAYLSVGEAIAPVRPELRQAILAENSSWQSLVMDLQQPGWQQHLVDSSQQLINRGFDGLFLDTLDSYMLAPQAMQSAQRDALANLINRLAAISPALILNRGFDILPALDAKPTAVVAESLYYGFDVQSRRYISQTEADVNWLKQRLKSVQQQGIEAIVLDYLPDNTPERVAAAKRILADGFTPYIADGLLTEAGVSLHYPVKRRVLGLYDSRQGPKKQSRCHRYLAMLVEYAGYVPDCQDINQLDGTAFSLHNYAGALLMLPDAYYQQPQVIVLLQRMLGTVPTVFIGALPADADLQQRLGITQDGYYRGKIQSSLPVLFPLPMAGDEQYPRYVSTSDSHQLIASFSDSNAKQGAAIIKAAWGGAVLEPGDLQELVNDRQRWMLDPFEHILPLLNLPPLPAPDITTESGSRIVTAHIDGDGFPSVAWVPGKPFAGESVYQRILQRYPLPHTVSVVEAEVAPHGLYPELAAQLEPIARAIFQLPHVELASHTFSHPFFWDPRVSIREKLYGDALPVPGYTLDYQREVAGSVDYINQHLAPAHKQVKVYLWSGMANPTPEIIAQTSALGLFNVNGGNTYVLNDNFSYAQVSPHLNWYPNAVQVYAPIMNENLYTELWTENFSGFARVTETFSKLGQPRRLKPVSIYYHMYSGMYPSSLGALDYIYQWAMQQPFTPLFLSEFAKRASGLYETGMAKHLLQPGYAIRSTGVKSLRLPDGFVIGSQSTGVVGVTDGPDGRYASLLGNQVHLWPATTTTDFAGQPYLQQANAIVEHWQHSSSQLSITLRGHVAVNATLAQTAACQVVNVSPGLKVQQQATTLQLSSTVAGSFSINLQCQSTATEVK